MRKAIVIFTTIISLLGPIASLNAQNLFLPEQNNKRIDAIIYQLNNNQAAKEQIEDILEYTSTLQNELNTIQKQYVSQQEVLQKKLDALGPKPENAKTEPESITIQRQSLKLQEDKLKAEIAQAAFLSAKIDEINNLILKNRNKELLNNISVKQSSIFHPQEFINSLREFGRFVFNLSKSPLIWYQNLPPKSQTKVKEQFFFAALSVVATLFISIFISFYLQRSLGYRTSIEHPNYWQKIRTAGWMFIAKSIVPASTLGIIFFWFYDNKSINNNAFGLLLHNIIFYFAYYCITTAVISIIFTPTSSKWRLIEVADSKAQKIYSALIFSTIAICFISFFQSVANQTESSEATIYSLNIFANATKALCIILVSKIALYDNTPLSEDELSENTAIAGLSLSSKISLLISFSMLIAFGLSLGGYIRLSEYIINHFIYSIVVIGIFYIFGKLFFWICHRILLMRFWLKTFRISHKSLSKGEFWLGLLLTPILWFTCLLTLLAVWGVPVDLLLARVKSFLIGFNIGGIHISIYSILLGIISFFVFLSLFKVLKNSFSNGNLSKIEMDDGIRNSIVSSINFLGFIISGILAIAVMGGSLSSIAIIAGALSFGVGLGLQNMVGNLAAGMTILWERPIKLGDWVIINDQEGIVKQIKMRCTILETWDKTTVIIPNSDILSKSLVNYTYKGKSGRVAIKMSVGYESNVKQIRENLLEIASTNEDISDTPAPSVTFSNLGAGLEFQLNCYTDNIFKRAEIGNDLREKIITRFQELNIEMPASPATVCLEDRRKD